NRQTPGPPLSVAAPAAGARGRELRAAAERHGVAVSFEIVRGAAHHAVAGASERDLVVAGAKGRPIGRHFRLECRWWSALEALPGPVLATPRGAPPQGTAFLLLGERGDAAARLLEIEVAPVEPTRLGELIETYACEILVIG